MSCGRLWIPAPESGREVFEQVEAHELRELPRKPFVLATWSTGTVGPDIHVRVGKTLYSVPWRHIGWKVDARDRHDGADLRSRTADRHPPLQGVR
jgi:hypothetical protein